MKPNNLITLYMHINILTIYTEFTILLDFYDVFTYNMVVYNKNILCISIALLCTTAKTDENIEITTRVQYNMYIIYNSTTLYVYHFFCTFCFIFYLLFYV
jgi:hypothetical protein